MPELVTMPETCALAPNIAVAWLDAPVTIRNIKRGDQARPDFLAINPQGKVPALRFEDGDVLTEAAAILAWLGAEHGSEAYARTTRLGRKEAEALSFMTSEVHATYLPHFAAEALADGEAAQDEVKAHAYAKLAEHYAQMEATLTASGGTWYLEERSFADAYLYVLARWIDQTPLAIADYPALRDHRSRMEMDDGVKLALVRQGMTPLG